MCKTHQQIFQQWFHRGCDFATFGWCNTMCWLVVFCARMSFLVSSWPGPPCSHEAWTAVDSGLGGKPWPRPPALALALAPGVDPLTLASGFSASGHMRGQSPSPLLPALAEHHSYKAGNDIMGRSKGPLINCVREKQTTSLYDNRWGLTSLYIPRIYEVSPYSRDLETIPRDVKHISFLSQDNLRRMGEYLLMRERYER